MSTTKAFPVPPTPSRLPLPPFSDLLTLQQVPDLPRADQDLDDIAWNHVRRLTKQSLHPKLSEDTWLEPIINALHAVAAILTPAVLASVAESTIAEHKARALATGPRDKAKKGKEKERDPDEKELLRLQEARRLEWRSARELLIRDVSSASPASTSTFLPDFVMTTTDVSSLKGSSDGGKEADADDAAWTTVAELPRLTRFRLLLRTTTATVGALKGGLVHIGIQFNEGEWRGRPLFGKDRLGDLDDEDLRHLNLVGGTLHLTSIPKDAPKLERILELLAFAVLTLKLEANLLHDTQCLRPPIEDDLVSNSATDSTVSLGREDNVSQPSENPTPDVTPETTRRSRWSRSGIWGLLTGSSSHSHSSGASASNVAPRKVKDKIKDGLRLRKARSNRIEGSVSSSLSRPPPDEPPLDTWDFIGGLGLGLGLGGLHGNLTEFKEQTEGPDLNPKPGDEPTERFQRVIKQMEQCVLSVSPNVIYPPPHLLVRLRQQEIEQLASTPGPTPPPDNTSDLPLKPLPLLSPLALSPSPIDRLRSYTTIDAQTLAMGFASGQTAISELGLHHPEFPTETMSSTTSRATRITLDARAGLASLMTNNNSLSGTIRHQGMQFLVETACKDADGDTQPCKPPTWLSFDYFESISDDAIEPSTCVSPDVSLGQLIERLVEGKVAPCATEKCKRPGSDHVLHWMHSKERISISLATLPSSTELAPPREPVVADPSRPRITCWTTCRVCHAVTPVTMLSLASYLFSFSKYAELLLYDLEFVPFPELCDHAHDRNALVRSFAMGSTIVNVELDKIELFELRLPTAVDPDIVHEELPRETDASMVQVLCDEINAFYHSVSERTDSLLGCLAEMSANKGAPSGRVNHASDIDADADCRSRASSEATVGPEDAAEAPLPAIEDGVASPLQLLYRLRDTLEDDKVDLLALVDGVGAPQLNTGRYHFRATARAAKARIAAWEGKHAGVLTANCSPLPAPAYVEPEYFASNIHVFPVESSVLVREDELSSAIALTLSARAFQEEVASPSIAQSRRVTPQSFYATPTPPSSRKSSRQPVPLELFDSNLRPPNAALPTRPNTPPKSPRPGTSPATVLDPDDSRADFSAVDEIECLAKPTKSVRGGGSSSRLLGMRGISRQASSDSFGLNGFFRGSPLATPVGEGTQLGGDEKRKMLPDSVLEDLVQTSDPFGPEPHPKLHPRVIPQVMATVTKRHVSEPTTTSSFSFGDVESSRAGTTGLIDSISSTDLSLPIIQSPSSSSSQTGDDILDDDLVAPLDAPERTASRLVNASLNLLSSIRNRGPAFGSPRAPADPGAHIKFVFRHGDKLFRVTSYFAQRFQTLRNRCGLSERLFIESLSRCQDLNPSGGKSKAAFWMTRDRRFMLKELTSMWGVSEKESFLTFAPELLNYLMSPERPSLLAKIFGFCTLGVPNPFSLSNKESSDTVKFKNLKTGETKKLDLVVMEHLFHSQTITRQFDLKGVASRVAKQKKTGAMDGGTGWDGDWLSGSLESRLLIYSHSKTLLRDALLNDSTFLSRCGNIDYSLLVGVDDARKELVVGLIDTLGVFNTLKMLENAGKTALKKATASDVDAVTVLPPSEYAARFRQGMERYFVAVPEKFSRGPWWSWSLDRHSYQT